jgi:cytochrome c
VIARAALFVLLPLLVAGSAMADDPAPGAAELQKCQICHAVNKGGGNRVGPNLNGVFGRKAGTAPGFNFSDAMRNSDIVWDDETLAKFLRDPKDSMPGNRMSFPGIKDDAALHDLVQQLKQASQ